MKKITSCATEKNWKKKKKALFFDHPIKADWDMGLAEYQCYINQQQLKAYNRAEASL